MQNYESCRRHMIDGQLRTNGITDSLLLKSFAEMPRERFLPEVLRGVAYIDEDIALTHGGFLMEPLIFARMLQEANISSDDVVLNIGDDTGYSSAILSALSSTVVTLESKTGALDKARKVWADLGLCNIAVVKGANVKGCPEHAPYSLIVINGSSATIPAELFGQVGKGGRIITVIRGSENTSGRLVLNSCTGEGQFSPRVICDASTPFVQGLEPAEVFAL